MDITRKVFSYINDSGFYWALTILWIITTGTLLATNTDTETDELVQERQTEVAIVGEQFHINGTPTYEGQIWTTSYGGEYNVEGLLMNARLVQGVFDDLNPD